LRGYSAQNSANPSGRSDAPRFTRGVGVIDGSNGGS
jgi:hypothetical protein